MKEVVYDIFNSLGTPNNKIPTTILYNEGWLLRVILDWFSKQRNSDHKLSFMGDSNWYSEALLESPFLPYYRGDKLAESWTHADGVIGNFSIGNSGVGDLKLENDVKQFIVLEAKMYSKLARGTTNQKNYDQVTRSIACMSNIISKQNISLSSIDKLAFYVLAPRQQLDFEKTFSSYINKNEITKKIEDRVLSYRTREDFEEKNKWFHEWFIPFIKMVDIDLLSWEDIISYIKHLDLNYANRLYEFYNETIKYNKK